MQTRHTLETAQIAAEFMLHYDQGIHAVPVMFNNNAGEPRFLILYRDGRVNIEKNLPEDFLH